MLWDMRSYFHEEPVDTFKMRPGFKNVVCKPSSEKEA